MGDSAIYILIVVALFLGQPTVHAEITPDLTTCNQAGIASVQAIEEARGLSNGHFTSVNAPEFGESV